LEVSILFEEKQKFSQWWIWAILIGLNGLWISAAVIHIIFRSELEYIFISNVKLLFVTGISILVTILFFYLKLETFIKKDGIYVRFFPFQISFRHFTWNMLKKSYIREYRPILEYGGWGLRIQLFRKGKAYTVSGNKGLQLEFVNNKKLLIGTKKAEELTEILKQLGYLNQ
jgi:hypothetical protein